MKPFLTLALIFCCQFTQAESMPGAFKKLEGLFNNAQVPVNVQSMYTTLSKSSSCAEATLLAPDIIDAQASARILTYSAPNFGPAFPAKNYRGIIFSNSPTAVLNGDSNFFARYNESIMSDGISIVTEYPTTTHKCDWVTDYDRKGNEIRVRQCSTTLTVSSANALARTTEHYVIFKLASPEPAYLYCWSVN